MPFLGVALEDRKPGEPAIWKFVDKETLLKERQAKIDAKAKKEAEKQAREALALKKKSTPASEWFKEFNKEGYT